MSSIKGIDKPWFYNVLWGFFGSQNRGNKIEVPNLETKIQTAPQTETKKNADPQLPEKDHPSYRIAKWKSICRAAKSPPLCSRLTFN